MSGDSVSARLREWLIHSVGRWLWVWRCVWIIPCTRMKFQRPIFNLERKISAICRTLSSVENTPYGRFSYVKWHPSGTSTNDILNLDFFSWEIADWREFQVRSRNTRCELESYRCTRFVIISWSKLFKRSNPPISCSCRRRHNDLDWAGSAIACGRGTILS